MSETLNERQREMARHALGFPNEKGLSYRNYYCVGTRGGGYEDWRDMVARGFAIMPHDGQFHLTEKGALLVREMGEHISQEGMAVMRGAAPAATEPPACTCKPTDADYDEDAHGRNCELYKFLVKRPAKPALAEPVPHICARLNQVREGKVHLCTLPENHDGDHNFEWTGVYSHLAEPVPQSEPNWKELLHSYFQQMRDGHTEAIDRCPDCTKTENMVRLALGIKPRALAAPSPATVKRGGITCQECLDKLHTLKGIRL